MKTSKYTPNHWHLLILFWLAVLLMMCGCSRTVYVPVESSRTDSLRQIVMRTDTFILRDSVYIVERIKGDTVFIEIFRYRYKDRIKVLKDTIYCSRTDTVSIPVPVEVKLTRWQTLKLELGGIAMGVIAAAVVGFLAWIAVKRRKK